jgi:predicted Na+-dependent transporter
MHQTTEPVGPWAGVGENSDVVFPNERDKKTYTFQHWVIYLNLARVFLASGLTFQQNDVLLFLSPARVDLTVFVLRFRWVG